MRSAPRSAEELDDEYNQDGDGEHPDHPRADWRDEVANENTSLGYWQWLADVLEEEEFQEAAAATARSSDDPGFGWHTRGVYIAHDPKGEPLVDTAGTTAHGTRVALLRDTNRPWSTLQAEGYVIHEYAPKEAS